ncbi:hypothetical protein FHW64_005595 [Variovorax sp. Sphag1AA]|nr:hypothetical protein [Variovorax sp. Sphag1AA]
MPATWVVIGPDVLIPPKLSQTSPCVGTGEMTAAEVWISACAHQLHLQCAPEIRPASKIWRVAFEVPRACGSCPPREPLRTGSRGLLMRVFPRNSTTFAVFGRSTDLCNPAETAGTSWSRFVRPRSNMSRSVALRSSGTHHRRSSSADDGRQTVSRKSGNASSLLRHMRRTGAPEAAIFDRVTAETFVIFPQKAAGAKISRASPTPRPCFRCTQDSRVGQQ